MRDISLHLLDIVQNSVVAGATLVTIEISFTEINLLEIQITDNGSGMSEEMIKGVKNPFITTRTTRGVGLGIPLLYQNAKRTEGNLKVDSTLGEGTTISVVFHQNHIDCIPLGNIGQTIATFCACYPKECDFLLKYKKEKKDFVFDTREVKDVLEGVPLNTPDVLIWVEKSIEEELKE